MCIRDRLFLLLPTEPFCWPKNAKTATVFLTCFDTTTFLQNLVLKWRRCHVFPAKMTLVSTRSMSCYEEISYSFSSSSSSWNRKVANMSTKAGVELAESVLPEVAGWNRGSQCNQGFNWHNQYIRKCCPYNYTCTEMIVVHTRRPSQHLSLTADQISWRVYFVRGNFCAKGRD